MKIKTLLALALLAPSMAMAKNVENIYENKFIGKSDITVNRFTTDQGRFLTCELSLGAKDDGDATVVIQGDDPANMHFYARLNKKPALNGWSFQLDNDRRKVEMRGLLSVFHKKPVQMSPSQLAGLESSHSIKIGVWDQDQEMHINEFDLTRIDNAVTKFKGCMAAGELEI